MRVSFNILASVFLIILSGCMQTPGKHDDNVAEDNNGASYAGRFSMEPIGNFQMLKVYSPWQKAGGVQYAYLLGDSSENIPDSLTGIPFIQVPVNKVIILSTTHVGYLDALDRLETIIGMSGTRYLYNARLRQKVSQDLIREVGFDRNLNYEMIIDMDPDVIFLYGVDASISRQVKRLDETGIPVVMCADYLEQHPLGRAEWIRFFAAFYRLDLYAETRFREVKQAYDSILHLAMKSAGRPEAFLGLPWKDAWYIAGGNSFAAQLLRDAGARYSWNDLESEEAEPMDLETVYSRIVGADYWINPGVSISLGNLIEHDKRFGQLPAVINENVYNNNRRMGPRGGNDYWESGVMNPHLVLQDLYRIFHGSSSEKDSLYYYRRLQ